MKTKDEIIKRLNEFVKRWCENYYPHLIDSDENDGEIFRQLLYSKEKEIERLHSHWKMQTHELTIDIIKLKQQIKELQEFKRQFPDEWKRFLIHIKPKEMI